MHLARHRTVRKGFGKKTRQDQSEEDCVVSFQSKLCVAFAQRGTGITGQNPNQDKSRNRA